MLVGTQKKRHLYSRSLETRGRCSWKSRNTRAPSIIVFNTRSIFFFFFFFLARVFNYGTQQSRGTE